MYILEVEMTIGALFVLILVLLAGIDAISSIKSGKKLDDESSNFLSSFLALFAMPAVSGLTAISLLSKDYARDHLLIYFIVWGLLWFVGLWIISKVVDLLVRAYRKPNV